MFPRLLALVYLLAFLSLACQITGLVGSRGILPAVQLLDQAQRSFGIDRYWALPTLAWIRADDGFLRFQCWAGVVLSALALGGRLQGLLFFLLWVLYLSLVTVGQDFLAFQWDVLLLESGFLAILLPLSPRLVTLLYRLLLFRLMFSSGVVKLASGDPVWRDLSALRYHYETQPIPNPVAWFAHQLPAAVHTASAAVMFTVELAVPFLVFGPRRARRAAAAVLVGFQALLALTGNYAFFNLLTAVLCAPLFRDLPAERPQPRWRRVLALALAAWIAAAGAVQLTGLFVRPLGRLGIVWSPLARYYIVNTYGLFAVMTTTRPEILVQGSNDGENWFNYEFRYKPGDVRRRPPQVAPHQPRLDWQMWFAALEPARQNPWFAGFVLRLLEGSPDVLALLAHNPFPGAPPRYVRAELYDYRFTGFSERRKSGAWWRATRIGEFFPAVWLRQ